MSSPFSTESSVVDQLSPTCIDALRTASRVGKDWNLSTVTLEVVFVGISEHPENSARTLDLYRMDGIRSSVRSIVAKKGEISSDSDELLPLDKETQRVLLQAAAIANHLSSSIIRSEHVLLALLGYNFDKLIANVPLPMNILEKCAPAGFRVGEFCRDLVSDLGEINGDDGETTVVRVGGTSNTGALSGTLAQVGVDLTQQAMEGKLDPVYGRSSEIKSCLRTLNRRRKNNPCLTGEAGVGKTAIAEGIAQVLAVPLVEEMEKNGIKLPNPFAKESDSTKDDAATLTGAILPPCPKDLAGLRLISVDLASLVAGTANRGDFEKRVQNLIREASSEKVILFIDEVHNLLGTGGGGDGAMNAANLLKPALARGEIRVMGATTTPEYRRYIEKDGALERRFQPLLIKEPSVEDTVKILASIVSSYEAYHGVEYTNNALRAAAKLSDRYIGDRFLPDKAIDMMDEAGSMVKMLEDGDDYFVTEDSVASIIADVTGIPVGRLDTGEKERLRNLETELGKRIKGQDPAVKAVSKAIRRARSGMRDGKRPVSTFLFAGPTGVGKTELCKALAETYFGKEKDMIRIDMSEYMDRFSVSRLVGAPPGYVGYEEGGQLTEAVRRSPHSVILFDEMEKAHEDVLNVLLQIMDDGVLTDGKGRKVNFKNAILALTTNVGSGRILEIARSGTDPSETMSTAVKTELEGALKPELLNRIDGIVVFSPLRYDNLREITTNLVDDTVQRAYNESRIELEVSSNLMEAITRETMNVASQFGARPLRRAVQRYVEDVMAEAIMTEFVDDGDQISLVLEQQASETSAAVVKARKGTKSISVTVDEDAGIGSVAESKPASSAYGDIPDLDDFNDDDDDDDDEDDSPKRATDSFQ